MPTELNIITARREQVNVLLAQHRRLIADLEAELVDLETAGKVIARLTGTRWPATGEAVQSHTQGSLSLSAVTAIPGTDALTMPEMLLAVLADAQRQGLRGMSPKGMAERIRERFNKATVKSDHVASIVWRVWKQGRIEKVGDGLYRLPLKNEATDASSVPDTSVASDVVPAGSVEPGPGGGT